MTGTKNPIGPRRSLRNLFSGVVGFPNETLDQRLERLAGRATQRREREERREEHLTRMAGQRKHAVAKRKRRKMLAAEYARDRRKTAITTKEG